MARQMRWTELTLTPGAPAMAATARARHSVRAQTIGAQQNDLRSPNMFLSRVAIFDDSPKPIHVSRSHRKGNAGFPQTRTPRRYRESHPGIISQIWSANFLFAWQPPRLSTCWLSIRDFQCRKDAPNPKDRAQQARQLRSQQLASPDL